MRARPGRTIVGGAAALGAAALGLGISRRLDRLRAEDARRALDRPGDGTPFSPAMTEGVPEAGRRWLLHAIRPGTPLARSVRLRMGGAIRLGGDAPVPMRAEQVLSVPDGLVWTVEAGTGLRRVSGVDAWQAGEGWQRFRLAGVVPVVRTGGPDVTRSAAGRVAGEAIWLPTALLPRRGARWEAVDDSTARVTVVVGGEAVTLTLTVAPDGRLERVELPRWSDRTDGGRWDYVPFAAEVREEGTFGGYTVPTRLCAGWRLGSGCDGAFFFPEVESAEYR